MDSYQTRQTLIQKIRDKYDDQAWEEFVYFYRRYIYVIIRNMHISHHDAEDLGQQVLVKVWQGIKNFDYQPGKHRFRGWLCTVTKNTVINYIKLKSNQMTNLSGSEKNDLQLYLHGISLPEIDKVARDEWENYLADLAMTKVKKLFQPQVMEAFTLFAAGRPAQEVADQLQLPLNTVHVYKKRVQNALLKEVQNLNQMLG